MFREGLIVIEGGDGVGKSTQAALLRGALQKIPELTDRIEYVREPGGIPLSEEIRKLLLSDVAKGADPMTELLLFWAARVELFSKYVGPAIRKKKIIITDRSDPSTYAYQVYGGGQSKLSLMRTFFHLRKELGTVPTLYLILDVPPEVGQNRRMEDRDQALTHFDLRTLEFHQRVHEGYRDFAKLPSVGDVHLVDGNRPKEAVHADLLKITLDWLTLEF